MKSKRIMVIAALVVGGLMVCLSAVLLFRGLLNLRREQEALNRVKRDMGRIYEREPFPSTANIEIERGNTAMLRDWHATLAAALRDRNIVSDEDSPSRFIRNYEESKRLLFQRARQRRVELPAGTEFAFGFDRYSGTGVLPQREHVAVLSEQLLIIERLCNLLFDSNIVRLTAVRRDPVAIEDAAVAPPVGRPGTAVGGRTPAGPRSTVMAVRHNEYYSRMQFTVQFAATENAFLHVMNALAADKMFAIVDTVAFEKQVPEMVPTIEAQDESAPASPASDVDDFFQMGAEAQKPEARPVVRTVTPIWKRDRDQRVISGPAHESPLQVSLVVSVYKFKGE